MRILIVDDTTMTRSLLRMILEKLGHEVLDAANVQSAVAIFCKEHPDFVFTDLNLAGESGMTLFSEIGSMFPDVPFVLMTASQDEKELQFARSVGMREVIQKPLRADLILKILEKHRPTDSKKRPVKLTMTVESRVMDKARTLARESNKTPEEVIQDFLHSVFDPPTKV